MFQKKISFLLDLRLELKMTSKSYSSHLIDRHLNFSQVCWSALSFQKASKLLLQHRLLPVKQRLRLLPPVQRQLPTLNGLRQLQLFQYKL